MECREVDSFAELSFDGELDAVDRAELERHLHRCPSCRRRVELLGWFQSQVRAHLQTPCEELTPPAELRTRVTARLRVEERRRASGLTRALPVTLGIAALATLSWSTTASTSTLDPDASVERHAARLPPEVRALGESRGVQRFLEQNFGRAVDIPDVRRALPHLRLVGARLDHVADRRAAYLMYDHRGARVSVLVYPFEEQFVAPPRFESRNVSGQPVFLGRHRGYNVMAWTRGDLVYSVVSDVDAYELERLVDAF